MRYDVTIDSKVSYCTRTGFSLGESVLLSDAKRRQYLIYQLAEDGYFHHHAGRVTHKNILATCNGGQVTTDKDLKLTVRRPLLWEYTCLMPRGPTPNYPKDIWSILGLLDVTPGQRVLEAGTGSGALTLHLSRAVGASGEVVTFEQSPESLKIAKKNVFTWNSTHGLPDNVHFVQDSVANASAHSCTAPMDSAVLDLVEPSAVLEQVIPVLKPGAPLVAYLPNVSQIMQLCTAAEELEQVMEVVVRDWTVRLANESKQYYVARPSHRQQPHTGFLAVLRRKP